MVISKVRKGGKYLKNILKKTKLNIKKFFLLRETFYLNLSI